MSDATYQRLRTALTRARIARGLSQADLAAELNEEPGFVRAYESGQQMLLVEDLLRVASHLQLDPSATLYAANAGESDGEAPPKPSKRDPSEDAS